MNRETESHFSHLPSLDMRRSSFRRPSDLKLTFSAGDLIPIYVDEILPGDTVKMNMASLVRMQTPIFPVMDNAYLDVYFFSCPERLIWDHWKEFWGENNLTAWEQQVEYTIPQIEAPNGGWNTGTIADYMGIPIGIDDISVSHLPFRAYCKIWNDFFRDENLKDPCMITTDETTVTGANTGDYVTYAEAGAAPLKAAKFHDYFTSALPAPQRGPSVALPLGTIAPVGAGVKSWTDTSLDFYHAINWRHPNTKELSADGAYNIKGGAGQINADTIQDGVITYPSNLYADLSHATAATINQLRQAFAVQAFYEAQARGGSRYIEFVKNIFGVTSPDARMQRPEYLGGCRVNINMDQVLQTSSTDATSPQGNTAAFSCTVNTENDMFIHSFTEHSILMGLAVIRTDHTYQQGIERFWSRKKWTDFYIPQFANLGEMPIYNREIYAQGTTKDGEVFGYQEAWADYRYKPSRTAGEMRSAATGTLDSWHYGDDYNTLPTLSSTWIDETKTNVNRTISVPSGLADQFFGDFYFEPIYVRPMPVYSVPATLNHF